MKNWAELPLGKELQFSSIHIFDMGGAEYAAETNTRHLKLDLIKYKEELKNWAELPLGKESKPSSVCYMFYNWEMQSMLQGLT